MLSFFIPNKISIFKVEGMMCVSGCVWKVNSVTESIDGVNESNVDFEKGILTVKYDSLKTNNDIIISELSKQTTYTVKEFKKNSDSQILNWFNRIFK